MLVFSFAREKFLLNKCLQFLHQTSCGEGRASQAATVASLISHIYLSSSMALKYGVESHMPLVSIYLEKVITEGFFLYFQNDLI